MSLFPSHFFKSAVRLNEEPDPQDEAQDAMRGIKSGHEKAIDRMMADIGEETAEALLDLCTAAGDIKPLRRNSVLKGRLNHNIQKILCLSKVEKCAKVCTSEYGKSWDHRDCQNTIVADLSDLGGIKVTCQHLAMARNGDQIMEKYGHACKIENELDMIMNMLQTA